MISHEKRLLPRYFSTNDVIIKKVDLYCTSVIVDVNSSDMFEKFTLAFISASVKLVCNM